MSNSIVITLPTLEFLSADSPKISFTLPIFSFESYGGGVLSIPELPTPDVSITGSAPLSTISVTLPNFSINMGSGYPTTRGAINLILPSPNLFITNQVVGSCTIVLPPLSIAFGQTPFNLTLPVLDVLLSGRSLPIEKIHVGVVMNLATQAVSTYNAYPFDNLLYFNGKYYGANSSGIYEIGGNMDAGNYIHSKIKTAPLDFGDNFIKYLRDVWLTYRSDGHLAIVFATKEDESNRTEEFPTEIVEEGIREERIHCPRGLRGRYYIIELKNLSGADFDIDQISMTVEAIRKRIR